MSSAWEPRCTEWIRLRFQAGGAEHRDGQPIVSGGRQRLFPRPRLEAPKPQTQKTRWKLQRDARKRKKSQEKSRKVHENHWNSLEIRWNSVDPSVGTPRWAGPPSSEPPRAPRAPRSHGASPAASPSALRRRAWRPAPGWPGTTPTASKGIEDLRKERHLEEKGLKVLLKEKQT